MVGTQTHSIAYPSSLAPSFLLPYSSLLPLHPPGLPGPPATSLGPLEPHETLKAFSSLGTSVRLWSLAPLTPRPPWPLGPLEPQEALEVFGSPGASVRLRGLAPLTPSHLLGLFASQDLPRSSGAQEALEAFSSLRALVRLRSLAPPCPLGLSGPLGPLKPWKSLAASRLQTQGPCSPLPLTPPCPLAIPCSVSPLGPPWLPGPFGASGSPWSLWQFWDLHQTQGPCSPSLPLTQSLSSSLDLLEPQEALEAFSSFGAWVRLRDLASPHPQDSQVP